MSDKLSEYEDIVQQLTADNNKLNETILENENQHQIDLMEAGEMVNKLEKINEKLETEKAELLKSNNGDDEMEQLVTLMQGKMKGYKKFQCP